MNEIIEEPEWSDLECEIFGLGRAIVVTPLKGNEPNWFWRWMQYLVFGNKWVRREVTQL